MKILATLLVCATSLFSQTTGELRITVKDPSGAGVAASAELVDRSNGARQAARLPADGVYAFQNLPFGTYQLSILQPGFAPSRESIEIRSAAPVEHPVTLQIGALGSSIEVVATTPLPGTDQALDEIAAPVQTADSVEVAQSGALDLSDLLNRRIGGIHLNDLQGNPFQADASYRGYTASPLLGTPQGLSVYLDGTRMNQPFGDVVSWDLIPLNAISSVTLIPGSDPLFGLNTLGGSLSMQTKDGYHDHATSAQVTYGASGRKALEVESGGGNATGLNWFFAGNLFHESGWRFASPTDVRQGFGKLGWRTARTDLAMSLGWADNSLTGNGLQDPRLLAQDWSSVYTIPDITKNHAPFVNLTARHDLGRGMLLAGNAYFRNIHTSTLNGDLNDDSFDQSIYQTSAAERTALATVGYTGIPTAGSTAANTPFPSLRCIAQALLRDEPGEKCNGVLNRGASVQNNYGTQGQFTWLTSNGERRNQFTAGAAYDRSLTGFRFLSELGYLNPDRSFTGVGAFGDGVSGGNVDGEPYDTRVNLDGRTHTGSLFATDAFSPNKVVHLTFSGRYNRTVVSNFDRLRPAGGAGSLNGHQIFERFNPAVGATFTATKTMNVYASYTEGSRAPTSIELGCADAANPCNLPNAMAGDPPLKQVLTRTWEAGVRGKYESGISWNLGAFRGENYDDLLFVSSPQTGFGYFKNFGKTLRQGFQFGMNGRLRRLSAGVNYNFLDATYQTTEIVDGSSNNTNSAALGGIPGIEGTITIQPGNRIPLTPRHTAKFFADLQATKKLEFDLGVIATSSSIARGNENNAYAADGKYYLGPGVSGGYAVVNTGAHYDLTRHLQIAIEADNILNRHYYTGAQLGPAAITGQGTFLARPFASVAGEFPLYHETFFAPGAPRRAWAELRVRF